MQPHSNYAIDYGQKLEARHHGRQIFGRRSLNSRLASSGAIRAVEQYHRLDPGALDGSRVVSSALPSAVLVHIDDRRHRGRVFFVRGPLGGVEAWLEGDEAVFELCGSITLARALTRRGDPKDPQVHRWTVAELDPIKRLTS